MADIENLREPLRSIVKKIIAESGGRVTLISGYRTNAEQRALYAKYLKGEGNLAAKPGTSQHEHGMAVDFGGDLSLAAKLAAKYGLNANVPGEPWHFSLGGEGGQESQFGYDVGGTENPQDVLANRLHSVLRIIGLDPTVGTVGTLSPDLGDIDTDKVFRRGMDDEFLPSTDAGRTATGAKAKFQQYAREKLLEMGLSPSEFPALVTLWNKESGWNPQAQNPTSTAFGIAQFLNSTWKGVGAAKTPDPYQQIDAGLRYILGRYKTPSQALSFHNRNNWY